MADDRVFKALADPHRRTLLDLLFQQDGRSLSDLQAHLPMTRFGVMKHLQNLEDAGLVTSRKVGREKLHYLNPVPIQQVYDRWVSKYARSWASTLTRLKYVLEDAIMTEPVRHVFVVFIRTTPERLWQALTDGTFTEQYYFGSRVESSWERGAAYRYPNPAGGLFVEGNVLESDPPRRLVMTFRPVWLAGDDAMPLSTVTWEIESEGSVCKLTLIHADLDLHQPGTEGIFEGWSRIVSGLKTVLETGEPLFAEHTGGAS
ncbi:MAG: metalloregulator ArsR/SmtB family transcription factor [Chloroflexi bacterium]|nr:metalloregulator ArsR/SmtB family transcription factor [Chloroflexota bacterium]